MCAALEDHTKKLLASAPLLSINSSPRDSDWPGRLKEEYTSLIHYISKNKDEGKSWFSIESSKDGRQWSGKCWYVHNFSKYEFNMNFSIPTGYPSTAPEIYVPELEGKTAKMYKDGKICLTDHFYPLWAKNVPKFGISHLLILGLSPWLAVEIPDLLDKGKIAIK